MHMLIHLYPSSMATLPLSVFVSNNGIVKNLVLNVHFVGISSKYIATTRTGVMISSKDIATIHTNCDIL